MKRTEPQKEPAICLTSLDLQGVEWGLKLDLLHVSPLHLPKLVVFPHQARALTRRRVVGSSRGEKEGPKLGLLKRGSMEGNA